jgi:hypothetical protein
VPARLEELKKVINNVDREHQYNDLLNLQQH